MVKREKPMRVTLVLSPSGEGCEHVHILNAADRSMVGVITLNDLAAGPGAGDAPVVAAVKLRARQYLDLFPSASHEDVKGFVEAEDL